MYDSDILFDAYPVHLRIVLRKNVDDALSRLKGRFKLADGYTSTDDALRATRGRAPGEPLDPQA